MHRSPRSGIITCVLFFSSAARTTAATAADTSVLLFAATATMMLLAASANCVLELELAAAAKDVGFVVSTPSCTDTPGDQSYCLHAWPTADR